MTGAVAAAVTGVGPVLGSVGDTVSGGSLLLAVPIAFAAGVLSFLSPCVLPLVPAYLSYITGLTGAELAGDATPAGPGAGRSSAAAAGPRGVSVDAGGQTGDGRAAGEPRGGQSGDGRAPGEPRGGGGSGSLALGTPPLAPARRRSRVALGTGLFVAGFTAVFVSYGLLFGGLGGWLLQYEAVISRVLGVVVIVLGLAFAGWLPGLNREWRLHRAPSYGLWGAPVLGALFGLGWTPCIGPTLAAVQTLAFTEASAARGALLSLVYCVGLGLPFLVVGLAFRRALGALGWVKRHYAWVMRIGGLMLVLLGLLLVTGWWTQLSIAMRTWVGGFEVLL